MGGGEQLLWGLAKLHDLRLLDLQVIWVLDADGNKTRTADSNNNNNRGHFYRAVFH